MKYLVAILVGFGLLAAAFGAGYYSHKPEVQIITQRQIQQAEQLVKQIITKRSKEPDGTSTETITETLVSDTKTAASESQSISQVQGAVRPDWSLGLKWRPQLEVDWSVPVGVEVGRRVVGDVWVTGEYQWDRGTMLLGVRYEW